jgi:hypothetical protein
MSVLLVPKPVNSSNFPFSREATLPQSEPRRLSSHATRAHVEPEPPEEAVEPLEAPEWDPTSEREAPDAGKGCDDTYEHEFRHGRSKS